MNILGQSLTCWLMELKGETVAHLDQLIVQSVGLPELASAALLVLTVFTSAKLSGERRLDEIGCRLDEPSMVIDSR